MTSTADETAGLLTDASPPSDPDNYSFYRLFPVGEVEESVGKAATVDGTHLAVSRYEGGYHAVDKRCTVYDLWATVLHQLGIRHKDLTYRYGGRDLRLTDVHGNVLRELLA